MSITNPQSSLQQVATGNVVTQGQLLTTALAPVADDLSALNSELIKLVPAQTVSAKAIIEHVFAAGGKRIRPALYFLSCRLYDYRGPHLLPIAAVSEYVHTASLLHDDVVDNSTLRRNKPTANSVWGDQAAVLVGDLIYARASELMAETGSLEIVSTFANAIRLMSEGELLQLENCFNSDVRVEDYLQILRCKTAVLIAASCRAAGILAESPREERDALSEFGHCVGMAFQLIDDALDYLSNDDAFGKPTQADLLEGKITLPVILLRDVASPEQKQRLQTILQTDPITPAAVSEVAQLVQTYGTATKTIELAQEYTERAQQALGKLPAGPAREDLQRLAEYLVWRFS